MFVAFVFRLREEGRRCGGLTAHTMVCSSRPLYLMAMLLPIACRSFVTRTSFVRAFGRPGAREALLRSYGRTLVAGRRAKADNADPNDPSNLYRDTVALPQTGFDQRANAAVREPQIQSFWEEEQIYKKLLASNPGE